MLPVASCKRCGGEEDELHVFLRCPFATEIWNLAPISHKPSVTNILSVQQLIEFSAIIPTSPPTTDEDLYLLPWILWQVWKARNILLFENRLLSEQEFLRRALKDAKQWSEALSSNAQPQVRSQQPATPPIPPIMVLVSGLVDGAWNSSSRDGGMGWVFKDRNNHTLLTGSDNHKLVSSALMCEALSLLFAMEAALAANLKSVCFYSDSQSLITMINSRSVSNELYEILYDIWSLSLQFEVSVCMIPYV